MNNLTEENEQVTNSEERDLRPWSYVWRGSGVNGEGDSMKKGGHVFNSKGHFCWVGESEEAHTACDLLVMHLNGSMTEENKRLKAELEQLKASNLTPKENLIQNFDKIHDLKPFPEHKASKCENCDSTGWVCEEHTDKPSPTHSEKGCNCGGAGSPCPVCKSEYLPEPPTQQEESE